MRAGPTDHAVQAHERKGRPMLAAFIVATLGVPFVALAVAALRRLRARRQLAELLVSERLDVYELAFLAGGADHVGTTALTAMSMNDLVRVSSDGTVEVVLPEAGHPMEEAVLEALGWPVRKAVTRAMRVAVPRRLRQVYAEVTRSRQLYALEQRLAARRLCVTEADARTGARSRGNAVAALNLIVAAVVAVACATSLLRWPMLVALVPAATGLATLALSHVAPGWFATGASSADGVHADADRLCNDRVVGKPGEQTLRTVAVHGAAMVPDTELRELISAVPPTRHHGAARAQPDGDQAEPAQPPAAAHGDQEPEAGAGATGPVSTGATATGSQAAHDGGRRSRSAPQADQGGGHRAARGRRRA